MASKTAIQIINCLIIQKKKKKEYPCQSPLEIKVLFQEHIKMKCLFKLYFIVSLNKIIKIGMKTISIISELERNQCQEPRMKYIEILKLKIFMLINKYVF